MNRQCSAPPASHHYIGGIIIALLKHISQQTGHRHLQLFRMHCTEERICTVIDYRYRHADHPAQILSSGRAGYCARHFGHSQRDRETCRHQHRKLLMSADRHRVSTVDYNRCAYMGIPISHKFASGCRLQSGYSGCRVYILLPLSATAATSATTSTSCYPYCSISNIWVDPAGIPG